MLETGPALPALEVTQWVHWGDGETVLSLSIKEEIRLLL